jgi:hypothetical protein
MPRVWDLRESHVVELALRCTAGNVAGADRRTEFSRRFLFARDGNIGALVFEHRAFALRNTMRLA